MERGMNYMNWISEMERKFGKYAISNLSLYLILCYACGYLLYAINPAFLNYLTLNPYMILRGQVWRLVTWILVPPGSFDFWTLIMLYFYYSIGTNLERTWGAFYYNVYLFLGMFFTIAGSFVLMGITYASGVSEFGEIVVALNFANMAQAFSTYYINMSIFLAFAATFPEAQVLLMFIIPIKVKWIGVAYAIMLLVEFIQYPIGNKIIIAASLLNFVVFFLLTRKGMHISPKQMKRRYEYKTEIKKVRPVSVSKHKCAICGKNSEDNPEAEFRFCSKCNGNYEYCQDHLFTHTHIK